MCQFATNAVSGSISGQASATKRRKSLLQAAACSAIACCSRRAASAARTLSGLRLVAAISGCLLGQGEQLLELLDCELVRVEGRAGRDPEAALVRVRDLVPLPSAVHLRQPPLEP